MNDEGLPPSSPVASPLRKKSRQDDEAELIAARDAQQMGVGLALNGAKPEWVTDLKQHIAEQFSQFGGLISGFNQRLKDSRGLLNRLHETGPSLTMQLLHSLDFLITLSQTNSNIANSLKLLGMERVCLEVPAIMQPRTPTRPITTTSLSVDGKTERREMSF